MAYSREGIDAKVREMFTKKLNSSFVQRNAWLYFSGMRDGEAKAKLGQPKAGAIWGQMELGESQRKETLGSKAIFHSHQKNEPNDAARVEYGGATPVAAGFAEDNEGMTEYRWTHVKQPLKIRKHSLLFAKGEHAIGSIVEKSTAPVINSFLKRINGLMLYGGTATNPSAHSMNTAAQQSKTVWDEQLGLIYVTTAGNTLGRVDRSVETVLQPSVIDSATHFSSTIINLDMNRDINNGYVRADTSATVDGLADKDPDGTGPDLWVTTPLLYNELVSQAEARGINQKRGVEGHAMTGFEYSFIEQDNVIWTYDKNLPSGTALGLPLKRMLIEIAPGFNFSFSGFTDKEKTEEGGDAYEWANFELMYRQSYERPDLFCRVTGLTAV